MVKCEICGKEFSAIGGLARHINNNVTDHITQEEYYNKYINPEEEGKHTCSRCNRPTEFVTLTEGYYKTCHDGNCLNPIKESPKLICEICGKQTTNLGTHVIIHNMDGKEYYDKYLKKDGEGVCPTCGKSTNFERFSRGYSKHCSIQCMTRNPETTKKRQETSMDKYGVISASILPEVRKKVIKTTLEKFGVECSFQAESVKEKMKQTNLEKFGVENPQQNKNIRAKTAKTNLERYGTETTLLNSEIHDKVKKTMLKNWGVDHSSKSPIIIEKRNKTNNERYGGNSPACSEVVLEKMKNTTMERFGVTNYSSTDECKEKMKQSNLERYGKEYYSQSEIGKEAMKEVIKNKYGVEYISQIPKSREKQKEINLNRMYDKLINSDRLQDMYTPLFTEEEYTGVFDKHMWRCNECNTEFSDDINGGSLPRCPKCFPKTSPTSIMEQDILEFCKQYYPSIISRSRSLLGNGKEIDMYIPDLKLGIEFNGLYWHSEEKGKDKQYHLEKTKAARNNGIDLVQIFEDEWVNHSDIVKSILLYKMNKLDHIIDSSVCIIKLLSNDECIEFLNNNHLSGYIKTSINIGLFDNDELLASMHINNSDTKYKIERFCIKNFYNSNDSFSILFNYVLSNYNVSAVYICSDNRYDNIDKYEEFGMHYFNELDPLEYYIINSYTKITNNSLYSLLKEDIDVNKFNKIYDCGYKIYEYNMDLVNV